MFIPKILALIAAQRHAWASTSTRPAIREQHGLDLDCGTPIIIDNKSFNTLTQIRKSGQCFEFEVTGSWAEVRVVEKKMLRKKITIIMNATLFEFILKLDICIYL